MMENICPKCKDVLKGDRPKFCQDCGYDLSQQPDRKDNPIQNEPEISAVSFLARDDLMNTEQKEAVLLEKMKTAMKDGNLPLDEISKLSALREELGITAERTKELFEKAVQSFRPTQPDDLEDRPKGLSHGLALRVNRNRFYMEGFKGVLDIELEDLSNISFDSVKVEISGDLLTKTEHFSTSLEPRRKVEKRFSVKPSDAGINLVQFRVIARCGRQIYAFWAEEDFPVFRETKDFRQISIQAEKFIDNSVADNSKNMGSVVKNQIDSVLRIDKPKDANDIMREFGDMKPFFKMISLEYDSKLSEELEKSQTISTSHNAPAKRIIEPGRGSLTNAACLKVESKDKPVNIVLIARPSVTVGRSTKNDIVARILPRSKENDRESRKISAMHCRIGLCEKGLFVKDDNSDNGTLLDDRKVDFKGMLISNAAKKLRLAEVLSLSIKHLSYKYGPKGEIYQETLPEFVGQTWQKAAKIGINSITLSRLNNLGPNTPDGIESYCVIYKMATIGSSPDCSITFTDKGLEPIHAVILYLANRFYMENLTEMTNVFVKDFTLSKNELIPLSFGDRIQIARMELQFRQKSQLFVE